jgi:hypothetical protein
MNLLAPACLALFASTVAFAQIGSDAANQPIVTLLDAGAEPRQVLRYRFDDGSSEVASIEMDIELNMTLGVQIQPVAFPTVRMLVDLGPIVIADDGSARYDFAISSAELVENPATNPVLATALRESLVQLPDISGWARIDSRGRTLDGALNAAAALDPELDQVFDSAEQALQQMSAPLPLEPVGIGAAWQVIEDVESAGFSVTQTAVYTLKSADGSDVTLDIALTQSASAQTVDFAGLPAGVEARLDSLESSGAGTMQIALDRFVPALQSAIDMVVALGLVLPGQAQQFGLDMRTALRLAPVE